MPRCSIYHASKYAMLCKNLLQTREHLGPQFLKRNFYQEVAFVRMKIPKKKLTLCDISKKRPIIYLLVHRPKCLGKCLPWGFTFDSSTKENGSRVSKQ